MKPCFLSFFFFCLVVVGFYFFYCPPFCSGQNAAPAVHHPLEMVEPAPVEVPLLGFRPAYADSRAPELETGWFINHIGQIFLTVGTPLLPSENTGSAGAQSLEKKQQ